MRGLPHYLFSFSSTPLSMLKPNTITIMFLNTHHSPSRFTRPPCPGGLNSTFQPLISPPPAPHSPSIPDFQLLQCGTHSLTSGPLPVPDTSEYQVSMDFLCHNTLSCNCLDESICSSKVGTMKARSVQYLIILIRRSYHLLSSYCVPALSNAVHVRSFNPHPNLSGS